MNSPKEKFSKTASGSDKGIYTAISENFHTDPNHTEVDKQSNLEVPKQSPSKLLNMKKNLTETAKEQERDPKRALTPDSISLKSEKQKRTMFISYEGRTKKYLSNEDFDEKQRKIRTMMKQQKLREKNRRDRIRQMEADERLYQ